MMRHFLEVDDLSADELQWVLDMSSRAPEAAPPVLQGSGVALVFEKPSNRTRNSMEMAVHQLGGHPVYIRPEEVGMDVRETAEDIARTLACFHDIIAVRVFRHNLLERMAACAVAPVINLLSDDAHPCQALADLLTVSQCIGLDRIERVAFVGDANNVWRSLAIGCAMLGIPSTLAVPDGYGPSGATLDRIAALGGECTVTDDPAAAAAGADVVYTDVWTSMGQEDEQAERLAAFGPYQVTPELMSLAADGAIFLHDLPAHRGEEVAAEVIDGPASRIWQQAENRMHAARGLLAFLAGTALHGAASAGSALHGAASAGAAS
ncbi:MAG: ornithine carbamoyltransferase [Acidimicrobiales bacterium]|nr:ornithine carbamoyltransferase [Acidimicrobiales bacterium]MXY01900.1 ornithine carbamoyltransferase [Acidimicrobiales bacterium]MXZ15244.1 ornithine carbamoyltransferase [Acidimicrobiales bacterium]MYA26873.1 ornithine carbamoyltransferase [Acidimicrobiales bacterium]MYA82772.1 ornithine carbamoyltransferase [Acidimicrobiales bacterium]